MPVSLGLKALFVNRVQCTFKDNFSSLSEARANTEVMCEPEFCGYYRSMKAGV